MLLVTYKLNKATNKSSDIWSIYFNLATLLGIPEEEAVWILNEMKLNESFQTWNEMVNQFQLAEQLHWGARDVIRGIVRGNRTGVEFRWRSSCTSAKCRQPIVWRQSEQPIRSRVTSELTANQRVSWPVYSAAGIGPRFSHRRTVEEDGCRLRAPCLALHFPCEQQNAVRVASSEAGCVESQPRRRRFDGSSGQWARPPPADFQRNAGSVSASTGVAGRNSSRHVRRVRTTSAADLRTQPHAERSTGSSADPRRCLRLPRRTSS